MIAKNIRIIYDKNNYLLTYIPRGYILVSVFFLVAFVGLSINAEELKLDSNALFLIVSVALALYTKFSYFSVNKQNKQMELVEKGLFRTKRTALPYCASKPMMINASKSESKFGVGTLSINTVKGKMVIATLDPFLGSRIDNLSLIKHYNSWR